MFVEIGVVQRALRIRWQGYPFYWKNEVRYANSWFKETRVLADLPGPVELGEDDAILHSRVWYYRWC